MLSKLIDTGKHTTRTTRPPFGVWCVLAVLCVVVGVAGFADAQVVSEFKLAGTESAFQETLDNGDRMGNAIMVLMKTFIRLGLLNHDNGHVFCNAVVGYISVCIVHVDAGPAVSGVLGDDKKWQCVSPRSR